MTEPNCSGANLGASDNESDTPASEDQAVINVPFTHGGPGLLTLPTELRLMTIRYLFVRPRGAVSVIYTWNRVPRVDLSILGTSRLLYEEASDVLYRENTFGDCCFHPRALTSPSKRIINKIQNIETNISMYPTGVLRRPYPEIETAKFLNLIKLFGDQSIVRGTLTVEFLVDRLYVRLLRWFVRALGRFTNLGIISLTFNHEFGPLSHLLNMREYLQTALEPMLGPARDFEMIAPVGDDDSLERAHSVVKGLRFHPVIHWKKQKPNDGDWADSLDGIRLEWN